MKTFYIETFGCQMNAHDSEKVFHRLQQFKREAGKGKIFGVLGCVAQQEGERIFERAPHVSLVAGSASYAKLPQMLVQLENGNRRVTGLSLDNDQAFETPFTKRDNPHRAYITIIEGLIVVQAQAGDAAVSVFQLDQHLGQLRIAGRTGNETDMRGALEDTLAFLLRDATENAKHFPLAVPLELIPAMKHLLLGLVANAAGV